MDKAGVLCEVAKPLAQPVIALETDLPGEAHEGVRMHVGLGRERPHRLHANLARMVDHEPGRPLELRRERAETPGQGLQHFLGALGDALHRVPL